MRRFLIVVLALAGCGDDMRGLNPIEMTGKAAGVYQGENPPPNTVFDQRNLDTSKGTWRNRPGREPVLSSSLIGDTPVMLAEYIPDHRFEASHYPSIIEVVFYTGLDDPSIYEIRNTEAKSSLSRPSSTTSNWAGRGVPVSSAMHLWKYKESAYWEYIPALVISDGRVPPLVYHQRGGTGQLSLLGAVDGGYSDITYLSEPPRGKCVAVFKDRLFMANTPDASNRVWFTAPDSGGTFVCNVWPSGYNFDVSQGEEIRALKVFRDQLIIFTANSIYAVSGDGVDGLWQVDLVDGAHGTINSHTVVDIGDSLVFMAEDGVYRWNGGVAQRVSHPALQKTWDNDISVVSGNTKIPSAVHDISNQRVLLFVGQDTYENNTVLAYNYKLNTWDIWGIWPNFDVQYSSNKMNHEQWAVGLLVEDAWFPEPTVVFADNNMLYKIGGNSDRGLYASYPIHWFMQTQRYWSGDPETKTLRHIAVQAKKTGDWDMRVMSLVNDENKVDAIVRNSSNYLIITDSTNDSSHDVNGNVTTWPGLSTKVQVDVIHATTLQKIASGVDALGNLINGKIVFYNHGLASTVAVNTTGLDGECIVVPYNEAPLKSIDMKEGSVYGTAYWGTGVYSDPELQKILMAENATGRSFSLWISNVGTYHSGSNWAKTGMAAEISGWALWTMPKGRYRP